VRIVVVNQHPSFALGGSETQCALLADALARRGHAVRYVAVGGLGPAPDPTADGVELAAVPADRGAVAEAILAGRPDVVYWRFGTWGVRRVFRRLRRVGTPVVFAASHVDDLRRWAPGRSARPPGPARTAELALRGLRGLWAHGALRTAAAVTVNNAALAPLVRGVRVVHIPNGVRTDRVPFDHPRPYVAWVANLKPAKRPEACLDLAEALAPLGVDVVMAGRIQVPGYDRFLDPGRLPANLSYLGPLDPTSAHGLLGGARVHVHTCEPEGFPNVFLQAWAQGVPSVSLGFDPGGVMAREGCGVSCAGDPTAFAAAVVHYLEDDPARDAAGAAAHRLVLREHSVEAATERLAALLEEVRA
jgi:glycosyltransferase involved in cell wall biosynthesis